MKALVLILAFMSFMVVTAAAVESTTPKSVVPRLQKDDYAGPRALYHKNAEGDIVVITLDGEPCVAPAHLAYFISADEQNILRGCWRSADGESIWIVWFDGDTSQASKEAFKPDL